MLQAQRSPADPTGRSEAKMVHPGHLALGRGGQVLFHPSLDRPSDGGHRRRVTSGRRLWEAGAVREGPTGLMAVDDSLLPWGDLGGGPSVRHRWAQCWRWAGRTVGVRPCGGEGEMTGRGWGGGGRGEDREAGSARAGVWLGRCGRRSPASAWGSADGRDSHPAARKLRQSRFC